MTEIKRSFYVLVAFMAVLVFLPLFRANGFERSAVSDLALSHGLTTRVLLQVGSRADGQIVESVENVHAIALSSSPASTELPHASECSDELSDIPQSTLYSIAVEYGEPYELTESERKTIASAVQLEVLGRYSEATQFERPELKYYEMLAVAQVVRNRLLDESFPNDVKTVIYDSSYTKKGLVYQFSTSPYIKGTEPTELAYAAVDEVFEQGVAVLPEDYFYFCATWRESRFEQNNRAVLRFLGALGEYDKIRADATTFYAGVTIAENQAVGYVF